jgi:hypothetical protein
VSSRDRFSASDDAAEKVVAAGGGVEPQADTLMLEADSNG